MASSTGARLAAPAPVVRLRPLALTDLDDWVRWMNDRDVSRFLIPPDRPFRRVDAEMYWSQSNGSRSERAYAVDAAGACIGIVTLHNITSDRSRCELGIMIGERSYLGRGFGTATVVEAIRVAFDDLGVQSVALRVAAGNRRAIAAYERAGFTLRHRYHQRVSIDGVPDDELFMAVDAPTAGANEAGEATR